MSRNVYIFLHYYRSVFLPRFEIALAINFGSVEFYKVSFMLTLFSTRQEPFRETEIKSLLVYVCVSINKFYANMQILFTRWPPLWKLLESSKCALSFS